MDEVTHVCPLSAILYVYYPTDQERSMNFLIKVYLNLLQIKGPIQGPLHAQGAPAAALGSLCINLCHCVSYTYWIAFKGDFDF